MVFGYYAELITLVFIFAIKETYYSDFLSSKPNFIIAKIRNKEKIIYRV